MQMDGDESSNIEDRRGDGGGGFGGGGSGGGGFPIPMGGAAAACSRAGLGVVAFVVHRADPGRRSRRDPGRHGPAAPRAMRRRRIVSRPAVPPSRRRGRSRDAVRRARAEEHRGRLVRASSATWAGSIASPSWCCSATPRAPTAASARRRWGRSIARPTSASISTSASSTSWRSRFRAPGQFPQAYVIAHEIGHHVQNLLGISGKVAADAPEHEQARRQRAVGAGRAAGRLLRRRLGQSRRPAARRQDDRRQGRRAGAGRRHGDRRRPAADARRRAGSCPTASPTAPARSARAGSAVGLDSGDLTAVRYVQGAAALAASASG